MDIVRSQKQIARQESSKGRASSRGTQQTLSGRSALLTLLQYSTHGFVNLDE